MISVEQELLGFSSSEQKETQVTDSNNKMTLIEHEIHKFFGFRNFGIRNISSHHEGDGCVRCQRKAKIQFNQNSDSKPEPSSTMTDGQNLGMGLIQNARLFSPA